MSPKPLPDPTGDNTRDQSTDARQLREILQVQADRNWFASQALDFPYKNGSMDKFPMNFQQFLLKLAQIYSREWNSAESETNKCVKVWEALETVLTCFY